MNALRRRLAVERARIAQIASGIGRQLLARSTSPRLPTVWLTGAWVSQALAVAARLGLADRLAQGPKSYDALADEVGAHAPSLRRLLRMLVGLGLFNEDRDGRVRLTTLGACLRRDHPQSVHALALMIGSDWHWQAWGELQHAVITGESGFRRAHGAAPYEYLRSHPDAARVFDGHMEVYGRQAAEAAVGYDFNRNETVVDVGGGTGTVLKAVLHANPTLNGVLLDLPDVAEVARAHMLDASLAQRCSIVGGSFFDAVPTNGDVYLLASVIHNWDDDNAIVILQRCRTAMTKRSRLVLVELTMPTGSQPGDARALDLQMMVLFDGGRERTVDEYRTLLNAADLQVSRVFHTSNAMLLIEATPR